MLIQGVSRNMLRRLLLMICLLTAATWIFSLDGSWMFGNGIQNASCRIENLGITRARICIFSEHEMFIVNFQIRKEYHFGRRLKRQAY